MEHLATHGMGRSAAGEAFAGRCGSGGGAASGPAASWSGQPCAVDAAAAAPATACTVGASASGSIAGPAHMGIYAPQAQQDMLGAPAAVACASREPARGAPGHGSLLRRQRALPPPHVPAFLHIGCGAWAAGPSCNPFACPAQSGVALGRPSGARSSGNPFAQAWYSGMWTGDGTIPWYAAPSCGTAESSCAGSAARFFQSPACSQAPAGLQALGNPFSMPAARCPPCWAPRARARCCGLGAPGSQALVNPGGQASHPEHCRGMAGEVAAAVGRLGSPEGMLAGEVATMEAALHEFRALRSAASAAAAEAARLRAAAADAGAPTAVQAAAGATGGDAPRACSADGDAGSRAALRAAEARAEQLRAALALRRPALESIAARLREMGL